MFPLWSQKKKSQTKIKFKNVKPKFKSLDKIEI